MEHAWLHLTAWASLYLGIVQAQPIINVAFRHLAVLALHLELVWRHRSVSPTPSPGIALVLLMSSAAYQTVVLAGRARLLRAMGRACPRLVARASPCPGIALAVSIISVACRHHAVQALDLEVAWRRQSATVTPFQDTVLALQTSSAA